MTGNECNMVVPEFLPYLRLGNVLSSPASVYSDKVMFRLTKDQLSGIAAEDFFLDLRISTEPTGPAQYSRPPFQRVLISDGLSHIIYECKWKPVKDYFVTSEPLELPKNLMLLPSGGVSLKINPMRSQPGEAQSFVHIFLSKKVTNEFVQQMILNREPMCSARIIEKLFDDGSIESSRVSLICPVTLTRIRVPIRSADCSHSRCFDLETFVAYETRNPKGKCPVCNQFISWTRIFICKMTRDFLESHPGIESYELISGKLEPVTPQKTELRKRVRIPRTRRSSLAGNNVRGNPAKRRLCDSENMRKNDSPKRRRADSVNRGRAYSMSRGRKDSGSRRRADSGRGGRNYSRSGVRNDSRGRRRGDSGSRGRNDSGNRRRTDSGSRRRADTGSRRRTDSRSRRRRSDSGSRRRSDSGSRRRSESGSRRRSESGSRRRSDSRNNDSGNSGSTDTVPFVIENGITYFLID